MPPQPLGLSGPLDRQGHEQARLALVAVGHDGRDHRLRGQGALHQSRPLHAGLRARRQSLDRHHLLAACDPRRRRAANALPCARDHRQRGRHGLRRDLLRSGRQGAVPGGRSRDHRLQRRRHAAAAAQFGLRQISERARQFIRPRRQEPDVPSLCADLRLREGADRQQSRAADLPVEQGVVRHGSRRAVSCAALACSSAAARAPCSRRSRASRRASCPGARTITACSASSTATACISPRSARICRRSTTASRSIPC